MSTWLQRTLRVMLPLLAVCATAEAEGADLRTVVPPEASSATGDESALIARSGLAPEQIGYVLRDLDSGETVARHQADRAFMPASVVKIPTGAAALRILGSDHRFTTSVRVSGTVEDGVLRGDLALVGGGDPMLGSDALLRLCHDVRAAGVREIEGAFLYDTALLRARSAINPAQPTDATYNPGVAALSLDFNRLRVAWDADEATGAIEAYTVPSLPDVVLDVASRPSESGQTWAPEVEERRTVWRLSPEAPRGGEGWLPVRRPAPFTAEVFRHVCALAGVELPEAAPGTLGGEDRRIAAHRSPPLHEIVQAMMTYSNNLVAELVGLAAARTLTGEVRDLPESASDLAEWWHETLPEVEWEGFRLENHSGLGTATRVTPEQIVAVLAYGDGLTGGAKGMPGHSLATLMPASGWAGGLGGRMREPKTAFRVWAKTGTINYASGLAGYLYTDSGRRLAFAIFANDAQARATYDADPDRRREASRVAAQRWKDRAKRLEVALVTRWARVY